MKSSLFAIYEQNSHSDTPELSMGVYSSSYSAVEVAEILIVNLRDKGRFFLMPKHHAIEAYTNIIYLGTLCRFALHRRQVGLRVSLDMVLVKKE
jgi:hypothetical protein